MKAIICNEFAAVDKLKFADVDSPRAGRGQVVVDIIQVGIQTRK